MTIYVLAMVLLFPLTLRHVEQRREIDSTNWNHSHFITTTFICVRHMWHKYVAFCVMRHFLSLCSY